MTDQPRLPLRWAHLRVLTGLNCRTLDHLVQRLASAARTAGRGRPWHLPLRQRVLLTAAALRTNLTTRQLAAVFDLTQSMVQRVITDITARLADLSLAGPSPHGRRCVAGLDGTLIPVHDHTLSAPSKNYRRSIAVQVLARRCDRLITALSSPWPGNRNDIVAARAEHAHLLARLHPRSWPTAPTAACPASPLRGTVRTGASSVTAPGACTAVAARPSSTSWPG